MDIGVTTSSTIVSGMMDFGEALAPVEADVTISGVTFSAVGARDHREVARGVVRQVVAALAVQVHTEGGALAEPAGAGHGAPV